MTYALRAHAHGCLAAALILAGCDSSSSPPPDAGLDASVPVATCYRCHGDPQSGNNAPPPSTWAPDAPPDPHQRHLQPSDWRASVPCSACHVVPDSVEDTGHDDTELPAEVTWGELAAADAATPYYDVEQASCVGIYCHGATLREGQASRDAAWSTLVDPPPGCGSRCHDSPPPPPHPESTKCGDCHSQVADAAGTIIAPELHVDGQLQVDEVPCAFCHGDPSGPDEPASWAPPLDTSGQDATTEPGVGAHQEHLSANDWHGPIPCEECHVVPTEVVEDGHIDEARPAELEWGPLASASFASPEYDGDRCAGTYCHGAKLTEGGTTTSPRWTLVDGSQDECTSCHGLPPTSAWHPFVRDPTTCAPCHPYTGHLPDDPSVHIDGMVTHVESLDCSWCHGSEGNAAPPLDCSGESDTSLTSVGAHQSIVVESASTLAIACSECHIEPADWIAMGHRDGSPPAEVWFGPRAMTGDRLPIWDGGSCADTYCHDSNPLDLNPTKIAVPTWTLVDGSQNTCESCHGFPPWTDTHPLDPACGDCHSEVVASDHVTIIDKSLHIDGIVQDDG